MSLVWFCLIYLFVVFIIITYYYTYFVLFTCFFSLQKITKVFWGGGGWGGMEKIQILQQFTILQIHGVWKAQELLTAAHGRSSQIKLFGNSGVIVFTFSGWSGKGMVQSLLSQACIIRFIWKKNFKSNLKGERKLMKKPNANLHSESNAGYICKLWYALESQMEPSQSSCNESVYLALHDCKTLYLCYRMFIVGCIFDKTGICWKRRLLQ